MAERLRAVYSIIDIDANNLDFTRSILRQADCDEAVYACFGHGVKYRRMGTQYGPDPVPGPSCPADNGCYYLPNGTEAILIETADHPTISV